MLFPAADDLLTMFIALEVFSLPLYLMCGLARRRRLLSQEAALKYFLLGAFSSAFFLYGIALLYGYSGSLSLERHQRSGHRQPRTTVAGTDRRRRCCRSACCSKSVRCRSIRGSPTSTRARRRPITAFMAAATKIAAFGAMLRIFYVALPGLERRLAAAAVGDRDPDHGGRHDHRGVADATSSGCWPTRRWRTPGSS